MNSIKELLAIEARENAMLKRLVTLRSENITLRLSLGMAGDQQEMFGRILELCCAEWQVSPAALASPTRQVTVAWPRHVIFFLAREMTRLSAKQIGSCFSRDHTTVLHSVRVVRDRMETEAELGARVKLLRQKLEEMEREAAA